MATCVTSTCGKEIDWATTVPGNKQMPVDHDSAGAPDGTLAVWRDKRQFLHCRVLAAGEDPAEGEIRGRAHWATCPGAADHHKRAAGGRVRE